MKAACVLPLWSYLIAIYLFVSQGPRWGGAINLSLNSKAPVSCLLGFVPFYQIMKALVQLTTIKQAVPTSSRAVHSNGHAHISQTCTHTKLNQSFKVSDASISVSKSATIRQWVLFPPSLNVGLRSVGRRLFIVPVSVSVVFQPLIYSSRLIESSIGL